MANITREIHHGVIIEEDLTEWNRLVKSIEKVSSSRAEVVDIGFFSEHGIKLVTYAAANELGARGTPERSYIGKTFDDNREIMELEFKNFIDSILFKRVYQKKFLSDMGSFLKNKIKHFIYSGYWSIYKPNAPSTILRKGSSIPLIETYKLVKNITYKVRRKEEID